jgi:hypothetical protein
VTGREEVDHRRPHATVLEPEQMSTLEDVQVRVGHLESAIGAMPS